MLIYFLGFARLNVCVGIRLSGNNRLTIRSFEADKTGLQISVKKNKIKIHDKYHDSF